MATDSDGGTVADRPAPGLRAKRLVDLLGLPVVGPDGRLVAKVDDLELVVRADGRLGVSAVLTGPGALGPRMKGRFGQWVVAVWSRLNPSETPQPGRIPMADVTRVDSAVHLGRRRDELAVDGFERWTREHVVDRLPGHPHDD